MHFHEGVKVSTGFLANVKELVTMKDLSNTLQGSQLSCDADSVSTYYNQGYNARVLENGHHPHVLLLFEDLAEDDWQARAE